MGDALYCFNSLLVLLMKLSRSKTRRYTQDNAPSHLASIKSPETFRASRGHQTLTLRIPGKNVPSRR